MRALRLFGATRPDVPGYLYFAGCLLALSGQSHAQTIDPGALPENGIVVSGAASMTTPSSSNLRIDQASDRVVIEWDRFNIGQNASVTFAQPSSSAVALNRVLASDASQIMGTLNANGRVFLVNPSGVLFGRDAHVDVGGLVASTLNISNEDFLAGRYVFESNGTAGDVANLGTLRANDGGYIALLGRQVANEGIITARLGTVGLAAGERVTLDFNGDSLLRLAVDRGAVDAQAANHHLIQAAGGSVYMSASAANDLAGTVVNNTGIIEATSLTERNGVIRLEGGEHGTVAVSGTLDASGTTAGATGGSIGVFGHRIGLFDAAELNVSGDRGGGTINVGGSFQGAGPEPNASRVYVGPDAQLNADALSSGNGGDVVVWADAATRFEGSISARGGASGGDGGDAEVSGKDNLLYAGLADLRASQGANGTLLLDPKNITIGTLSLDTLLNNDSFLENLVGSVTLGVLDLLAQLTLSGITLQANNDITLTTALNALSLLSNNGLTLEAGRSIALNADVLVRGPFTATINSSLASNTARDVGAAAFTMAAGTTINTTASNGDISINVGTGAGVGTSGNITLANLNAGSGNVHITHSGQTAGSSILRASASDTITANSAVFTVNGAAGGGAIGTSSAPLRVAASHVEASAQSGGAFFTAPTGNLTIGGATVGGLTGISTTGGGAIGLTTSNGSITTSEAISAAAGGAVSLTAGGASSAVTIGAGLTSGSGALNLSAANGVTLSGATAQLSTTGAYTVNADSDANGTGVYTHNNASASVAAGPVSITAADINLTGTINAGSAAVTLTPSTAAATIGIGDTTHTFGISSAELGNLTSSGLITIGAGTNTGGITVGTAEAVAFGTRNLALTSGGNLAVNATHGISGTGALTLTADTMALNGGTIGGGSITLQPNSPTQTIGLNDAAGALNLTAAELQSLSSTGTVTIGAASGTGTTTIGSLGALDLSAESFGLALRGGATTFGAGGLILPNNSTLTLGGTTVTGGAGTDVRIGGATGTLNLNVTGNASLTTQLARVLPTAVGGNLTINNTGALDLGAASLIGNLAISSTGALTQSGVLVVNGTSAFNAGANAITLTNASNDFVGGVSLTGSNVSLQDTNALTLNTSGISGALTLTTNGVISQLGALTVAGTTTLNAGVGNNITLTNVANDFATVSINGGSNVSLSDANALALGTATVAGDLTLATAGAVTQSGALTVSGNTAVAAGSGAIALTNAANDFIGNVALSSSTNASITDANSLALANSTIGGSLAVSTQGALTDVGTITVAGTTSLNAGVNDIALDTTNNSFTGAVSVGGANNVTLVTGNALTLGPITTAGNFSTNVTSGNLTQTGALQVNGNTSLAATGAGATITLNNAANNFVGSVAANGSGNVSLTDTNALVLGASTIGGALQLNTNGALTQTAPVTVNGAATFNVGAGNNITLTAATNDFIGPVIVAAANNVSLVDNTALNLGASTISGNLALTGVAGVTQSGALTVNGTSNVTANTGAIALTNAANDFVGAVNLNAGVDAAVTDVNALALGTSNVAAGLTVAANGAITNAGAIVVGGPTTVTAGVGNDVTLNNTGNDFTGAVSVTSANNVTLVDANSLSLGNITTAGGLTATVNLGNLISSGALNIAGNAALSANQAGASITIDNPANVLAGLVSFNGSGGLANVSVADTTALDLGALTLSGNLSVNAAGITDSGNVVVGGTTTLAAGTGNNIVLDAVGNDLATLVINSANNVTVNDSNALDLGAASISGTLALTTNGALTDSGTINVTGPATLSAGAGGTITLDSATNDFVGPVAITALNATIVDTNALDLAASTLGGTLNVTTRGAITDSGTLSVGGTTTLNAGIGNTIALDQSGNDFVGAVSITGGSTTLVDTNALNLGTSAIGGNLSVTTGGAVTQTGALAINGATQIGAGGNITLDNVANNFAGSIGVQSVGNVALSGANALDLGASTIAGTLAIVANGPVTDSGAIVVGGSTTLNAGSGNITLDAGNDFATVSVGGGNNVVLNDVNALDLGAATIAGNLNVTTNGALSDSAALNIGGVTTLSVGAANDIVLDAPSNSFGAAINVGSANHVTLNAANSLDLGAIATNGNLTVTTATGDVSNSAALNITGNTNITANRTGASVALNNGANRLAGTVAINGPSLANVAITDTTALVLPALALTGNLNVNAPGVSSTAPLQVGGVATISAGGADVNLSTAGNDFNILSIASAANATITDTNSLTLGPSTITGGLTVTIGSTLGDSGPIVVGGTTSINAGADVTLDDANDFATIGIATSGNATVRDINSINLGTTNVSGLLAVNAGNAITQSVALNVGNGLSASAGTGGILLGNSNNTIGGTVTLTSGGDATLANTTAVTVGPTQVSGKLTITSGSSVSSSSPVNVGGGISVTAGQSGDGSGISLSGGGQLQGSVNLSTSGGGGNVNVSTGGGIVVGTISGGNVTISSGGSITNGNTGGTSGSGPNITATGSVGLNSSTGTVGQANNPVSVSAPSTSTTAGGSSQGVSVNITNTSSTATHTNDTSSTTSPGIVVVNGGTVGDATGSPTGLNPQTIPSTTGIATNVGLNTNPTAGPTDSTAEAEQTAAYETDSANRLGGSGCISTEQLAHKLQNVNQGMHLPNGVAEAAARTGSLEERQQASQKGFCSDQSAGDGGE
ncbi:beta strand repeat-containing protein [Steroidobacter sp.]|uniref:beta strand repeat-containing protein n=1 Tax=Steroidobacter sp. TaxID=1978227 RepID=UPI001A5982F7|nr:filamentous hemagglutinin N-terminal domain-containing protein [Steroidobacter sp.]MBL8265847.1 filamentous hemagglutinin N-terminal domain-containing protein [Steroidobacter sp.]